jgi:hypothetical protein
MARTLSVTTNNALLTSKGAATLNVRKTNVTDKPTIFFSHSARDRELLASIKAAFDERTGGVYALFLSSDGSSIPFGRNWTKAVEDGLERARLMYVFLTPASLASAWIYFEAGFAYSKGVRVVPVGLADVDLARVPPPLSLLQGFNLRNFEGLNNLLAVANETFAHSHRLSFEPLDFENLVLGAGVGPRRALGPFADFIDELHILLQGSTSEFNSFALTKSFASALSARGVAHEHSSGTVAIHGATLAASGPSASPQSVEIKIDCLAAESAFPIVLDLLAATPAGVRPPSINVMFFVSVQTLHAWHKVTARLLGTAGKFSRDRRILLGDCTFTIDHTFAFSRGDATCVYLSILKPGGVADLSDIKRIVEFAFGRGLLSVMHVDNGID